MFCVGDENGVMLMIKNIIHLYKICNTLVFYNFMKFGVVFLKLALWSKWCGGEPQSHSCENMFAMIGFIFVLAYNVQTMAASVYHVGFKYQHVTIKILTYIY